MNECPLGATDQIVSMAENAQEVQRYAHEGRYEHNQTKNNYFYSGVFVYGSSCSGGYSF